MAAEWRAAIAEAYALCDASSEPPRPYDSALNNVARPALRPAPRSPEPPPRPSPDLDRRPPNSYDLALAKMKENRR